MITISWWAVDTLTAPGGGDTLGHVLEVLTLDGTASETYTVEALATEHPVERAADIADHVKPQLRTIQCEVLATAHPGLGGEPGLDSGLDVDPASRPARVRQTLARIIDHAIEVSLETNVGAWESMLLLKAEEQRRAEQGDGYRAVLTFREIRRVSTLEVDAPAPRVERGRRTRDRGRQDGNATDGTVDVKPLNRQSALAAGRDAGAALLRGGGS